MLLNQIQLSKKLKMFCQSFVAFLELKLNLKGFGEKLLS